MLFCIVPEKREERTTEGGLEVVREEKKLAEFVAPLRDAGCRVSIFIAPDKHQIEAACRIGAQVIELHSGAYCDAHHEGRIEDRNIELEALRDMSRFAYDLGLEVHVGHGLTYETVQPVAAFLDSSGVEYRPLSHRGSYIRGFDPAIKEMRRLMDEVRN